MEHLINVLKGVVIGIANAIPGVSGGTMMVIMKVFDRLMDAVSLDLKKLKKNFIFLLTIGLGLGIGVILTAKVLTKLFDNYYVQTQFFFLGVVIGSIPMIYREACAKGKLKPIHILPFIIGLAVIIGISLFNEANITNQVQTKLTGSLFISLLIISIVAAIAMVMPGISGSLIFLILGAYQTIITAVDTLNIPILIPVAIGVLIGIIICAKVMSVCMKKYYQVTYSLILGLILGSIYAIFPKAPNPTFSLAGDQLGTGIATIIMLIIGIALPILMELPSKKKTNTKAVSAE